MRGELPKKIRALLAEAGKKLEPWQVCDRLDVPRGSQEVARCLIRMKRDGLLSSTGERGAMAYELARAPRSGRPRKYTDEQRIERSRERDRARYPKRKAQRQAKAAAIPKKPKSLAQRIFATVEPKLSKYASQTLAPQPAKPRPETVEEWMARTGQQPEILPGVQVKPLTFAGHMGQNRESMRQSLAAA